MPSAELFVRLLPLIVFIIVSLFIFLFSLKGFRAIRPCTPDAYIFKYARLSYLGASWTEACYFYFPSIKLITYAFSPICTFSLPLYASIWLKFWPSWVAWLLCLCPTFPLVRLGHKGSTSAIVTAGSSRCVPQTGWSRKLVFLREYSVGKLKMFLHSLHYEPPEVIHTVIFSSQSGHAHRCMHTQGRNP